MKRFTRVIICVIAIIIISILFCQIYSYGDNNNLQYKDGIITQYKEELSDDIIWDILSQQLDNEKIIAGIMGYFQRESKMRSDAIAGWPARDKRPDFDSSQEFTQTVDAGLHDGSTREYFIEQVTFRYGGYGLGQWLSRHYLEELYNFAQEYGTSIGDAEMQCLFTLWSMEHHTPELWEEIQNEENIWIIGRKIGHLYDGTGELGSSTIASYAQEYYEKYATN